MPAGTIYDSIHALVRQVPRGRVTTYGEIARITAATPRMVGWAMAAAPRGVPWQRVINSQGRVSARGGGDGHHRQRLLLEREGVRFDDSGRVDLEEFGWLPRS